jgi:acetolactate synthase-1/2/3 large subunit
VLPRVEPARAWPAPGGLRELRARLVAAQRPIVIAGGPGWDAEAANALQRFAENWQLPVACGWRFQDSFDNRHPLYAGDVGIGINPKLAARIREADLVIALGIRLGEMTTGGYTLLQAPRPTQTLVHIHPGAEELGRVYAADLMLQAAVPAAAKSLEALTAPPELPWRAHAAAARADYEANLEAPAVAPMDLAVVVKALQRLLPESTVYTNGAGNYAGWLHRFGVLPGLQHHGRTQLAPTSGAMGYGLPAAVAASLLQPHRWVVNLAGDGDFLMNGQELATATGYGAKKLLSIVVDNGTYGTIRMHQERDYPARVSGSDLFNPDFAALARAYGWHGEFADSTADAVAALERCIAAVESAGCPALLHLKLPTDVITSRTTLSAIREAALKSA